MLEVVGVKLSALNYVVRLYVVCELLDVQSDVLLLEDFLGNLQDLSVRCW